MAKKVNHTISRIVPDSRVIYLDENKDELYRVDSTDETGEVVYQYEYNGDQLVTIYIHHLNYHFLKLLDVFLGKKDQIFQVQQHPDRFYYNPE